MLNLLRSPATKLARSLEAQLVARARHPTFFRDLGVPDTMDGRFDMVALHAFLLLERLKAAGRDDIAQALTDMLFVGFDEALREQGTGDMGMGRRMRAFSEAFFGRLKAYAASREEADWAAALARNVWRGAAADEKAVRLAHYVVGARATLAACDIASGRADFGPLP